MLRARYTIFVLFWIGWVVVLPFAHHHLVRAPREGTGIHCGEQSCSVQCVACQWESVSTAEVEAAPNTPTPPHDAERFFPISLLNHRIVTSTFSPRAPPQG